MPKVAYLLAAYPGPRLNGDMPDYAQDYSLYLRYHLDKLDSLRHDCDIILCVNTPDYMSSGVTDFFAGLHPDIEQMFRPNFGASYGAWNQAFNTYKDYDYYILMEDDYVPMQHDFDKKLVDIIQKEKAPYVCTMLGWGHGGGDLPHAGISNGIVDGEVVRKVMANGGFPHSRTVQDYDHYSGRFGQVMFSQKFLEYGPLIDFHDYYQAPYWRVDHLNEYYPHNKEVLIAPYQFAKEQI